MIIRRVKITNFQSHYDTTLELSPGVNVIVGPSDEGKSAIIRAIRWAMRNRAPRSQFVSRDAVGDCLVGLAIQQGDQEVRVIRRRRGDENFYSLIRGEGDKAPFTGFGRDVPAPIQEVVGAPVDFAEDLTLDLGISTQGEKYFLVDDPRALARVLGKPTGIHVLEGADHLAARESRAVGEKLKHLREQRSAVSKELATIPDLDEARRLVGEADVAERRRSMARTREGDVGSSLATLKATSTRLTSVRNMCDRSDQFAIRAGLRLSEQKERTTRVTVIQEARKAERQLSRSITEARAKLASLPSIKDASPMATAMRRLTLVRAVGEINLLRTSIETRRRDDESVAGTLATMLDGRRTAVAELAVCPLSGGMLFDECKNLIAG